MIQKLVQNRILTAEPTEDAEDSQTIDVYRFLISREALGLFPQGCVADPIAISRLDQKKFCSALWLSSKMI